MSETHTPRYPVYIPSKGRPECPTAKYLSQENTPFYIVIEPSQYEDYAENWDDSQILTLPFDDAGSAIPSRNWIKQHSQEHGDHRHWQLDDNIHGARKVHHGKRIRTTISTSLSVTEDITDRYENIAISGNEYTMFYTGNNENTIRWNTRIYSCSLINNEAPFTWRGTMNADTDICLQALSTDYWTTMLYRKYLVEKEWTMQRSGGNTEKYKQQDGRLLMSKQLEKRWPRVVETTEKFDRAQHKVRYNWKRFTQKPKLKQSPEDFEDLEDKYQERLIKNKELVNDARQKIWEAHQGPKTDLT